MARRRRLLVAVALAPGVALVVAHAWPDPGRVFDLLTGHSVTAATESAFLTLLCGLAAAVLAVVVAGASRGRARDARPRRALSLAVLVVGLALLGAGLARHDGYRVCCATPTTAQEAGQLVH